MKIEYKLAGILSLTALLAPGAATALPDLGTRREVLVEDVAWTVLRDHKDPLLWYYAPVYARAAEVSGAGRTATLNSVIRYADESSGQAVSAAAFFFSLYLEPGGEERSVLKKAVGALAGEAAASPEALKLQSVPLKDVSISFYDENGAKMAEAQKAWSFGAGIDPAAVPFAFKAPAALAERGARGLSCGFTAAYSYWAVEKGPGGKHVPASAQGKAEGSLGAGAAHGADSGERTVHYYYLPPPGSPRDLGEVRAEFTLLDPAGKAAGVAPYSAQWRPGSGTDSPGGWTLEGGYEGQLFGIPTQALAHKADLGDYKLRARYEFTFRSLPGGLKKEAVTSLGAGWGPALAPARLLKTVRVNGELLTWGDKKAKEGLAAVEGRVVCGKAKKSFLLRPGGAVEAIAYFDHDCGAPAVEADYDYYGGKKSQALSIPDLREEVLYLQDSAQ